MALVGLDSDKRCCVPGIRAETAQDVAASMETRDLHWLEGGRS
jgi:hypothetical protein